MGSDFSQPIGVTKGLRQRCCVAPTLFKIYVNEALKGWKNKCATMGIPVGNDTLFSLNFADDQVLFAGDEEDASYMVRKLQHEYAKWGLEMNFDKTKYIVIGGCGKDLELENGVKIKKNVRAAST